MKNKTKQVKYQAVIAADECKGCERCVNACPKSVLQMGREFNFMGFPYAVYVGEGCIGCGACFYTCPEPGAITIVKVTGD
ncbi:MAG: 4Fe-4S dicluster domain-containing protein [Victivallaceae bacterium]|nr:4Fe-4S dicluster domain-containing protein [Victivallaceae bacterium]